MLFKLDRKDNKFIELKGINGYILILGSNHVVLISTINLVEKTKDNIIYFSNDYIYGSHKYGYIDSGAYNIRDKSITLFSLHTVYNLTKKTNICRCQPCSFTLVSKLKKNYKVVNPMYLLDFSFL